MDVSHIVRSCRRRLAGSSHTGILVLLLYCCCCKPEFDLAQLESRHDALDSPSTLGIRVPSPLAWGRNGVRELRAQRRHVLGDGGGGSIVTASPISLYEYDRGTSRVQYCCTSIVPGTCNSYHIIHHIIRMI